MSWSFAPKIFTFRYLFNRNTPSLALNVFDKCRVFEVLLLLSYLRQLELIPKLLECEDHVGNTPLIRNIHLS
mgnify:CR=1 FL=1